MEAENLFLRKQLALFQERKTKPRRMLIDAHKRGKPQITLFIGRAERQQWLSCTPAVDQKYGAGRQVILGYRV